VKESAIQEGVERSQPGTGEDWAEAWPSGYLPFSAPVRFSLLQNLKSCQTRSDLEGFIKLCHDKILGHHEPMSFWSVQEGLIRALAQARLKKHLGPLISQWVWSQQAPEINGLVKNSLVKNSLVKNSLVKNSLVKNNSSESGSFRSLHPIHPLPFAGWGDRAQEEWATLAHRFGITDIQFPAGLSVEEEFSLFREIECGLSHFCQSLNMKESNVGKKRFGLTLAFDTIKFDTVKNDNVNFVTQAGAAWHWLDQNMVFNVREGWGSFAHEWCHVVDNHWHILQQEKEEKIHFKKDWLSGLRSQKTSGIHTEDSPTEIFKKRFKGLSTQVERFSAFEEWLSQVPSVFERLSGDIQNEELRERFVRRSDVLKKWVSMPRFSQKKETKGFAKESRSECSESLDVLKNLETLWNRWKLGNDVLFSRPESHEIKERWGRLTGLVDEHWKDGEIDFPAWRQWAIFKDEAKQVDYWSLPHEELARSFHAVVFEKLGHESWSVDAARQADWYPQENDLLKEREWWQKWWPTWARLWESPSVWRNTWQSWLTAPAEELPGLKMPWCPEEKWPLSDDLEKDPTKDFKKDLGVN